MYRKWRDLIHIERDVSRFSHIVYILSVESHVEGMGHIYPFGYVSVTSLLIYTL